MRMFGAFFLLWLVFMFQNSGSIKVIKRIERWQKVQLIEILLKYRVHPDKTGFPPDSKEGWLTESTTIASPIPRDLEEMARRPNLTLHLTKEQLEQARMILKITFGQ